MPSSVLTLTHTVDDQRTGALYLPQWVDGFCTHVPALGDAAHTASIEVYTGASISSADAANALLAATSNTGWVAIGTVLSTGGNEVSVVPAGWPLGGQWIRFLVSVAQAATRTFRVLYSDPRN